MSANNPSHSFAPAWNNEYLLKQGSHFWVCPADGSPRRLGVVSSVPNKAWFNMRFWFADKSHLPQEYPKGDVHCKTIEGEIYGNDKKLWARLSGLSEEEMANLPDTLALEADGQFQAFRITQLTQALRNISPRNTYTVESNNVARSWADMLESVLMPKQQAPTPQPAQLPVSVTADPMPDPDTLPAHTVTEAQAAAVNAGVVVAAEHEVLPEEATHTAT